MNRIYLVRHGENPANITKEFSCRHVDYSLTAKGVVQAQQTAAFFADKGIDEIYASPLKRAAETAEIIADHVGQPLTLMEEFREVDVGELEQHPTPENWLRHNCVLGGWLNGQPHVQFPGGDSYYTLSDRMRRGIAQISANKRGKNIVVVAHGGIITVSLRELCPDADLQQLLGGIMNNCAVSEIMVQLLGGQPVGKLVTWADDRHLHGKAANFVNPLPEA